MKIRFDKKGFTLIELLIVIAIIGILAVAFLPSILDAPSKARDTKRIEDVSKITDFFTLYYAENGQIPGGRECIAPTTDSGGIIMDHLDDFGGVFPEDPSDMTCLSGGKYYYAIYNYTDPSFASAPFNYKYPFAVMAMVEEMENGNYDSSDPASNVGMIFKGEQTLVDEGDRYLQFASK